MIYDTSKDLGRQQCIARVKHLLDKGALVEVTEKGTRTRQQNRYLHLIIGVMAMETGTTLDHAKEWYFKRLANPDLFLANVDDPIAGRVQIVRSSTDLSVDQMKTAIDKFKVWASEQGVYLPDPEDTNMLAEIEVEMARASKYL